MSSDEAYQEWVAGQVSRKINPPIEVSPEAPTIGLTIGEEAYSITLGEAARLMRDLRRAIVKLDPRVLRSVK